MIHPGDFFSALEARGVSFFTGVPDSLLKDLCAYVTDHAPAERHVIAANEGGAVGLAAGHHLATGRVPVVYMQNSGLGNTVNPVTSLADPEVYGIPMLLIVGWRGEPGVKDEPQHVKMGRITPDVVTALGVEQAVLPDTMDEALPVLERALSWARERSAPFALLVRKGTFAKYKLQSAAPDVYPMTREHAIGLVATALPADTLIVSTTGMPSRELFEQRELRGEPHDGDFLTVGSMGHTSQIALGVALERPERTVVCLDGDGAVLMHMGSLGMVGTLAPRNYRHIVVNNGAHDSVGGQPTVAFQVDLCAVAAACGYASTVRVSSEEELRDVLPGFVAGDGPGFLEIRVCKGARSDLGRPTMTPRELKERFMARARA
ncbi:MAG: phosphonopyruvate decarboxylase [Myxococcales bacterium]